jgi:Arc/MetJ family transcription regulator
MRIDFEIDDKLMRDALQATGLETEQEVVEHALRTLLRIKKQAELRDLRGKVEWRGDLDQMRTTV